MIEKRRVRERERREKETRTRRRDARRPFDLRRKTLRDSNSDELYFGGEIDAGEAD